MTFFPGTIDDFRRLYPNAEIIGEPAPAPVKAKERSQPEEMAEPSVQVKDGKFIAVIPCVTASEANKRGWQGRSRRGKSATKAFREVLGPHLGLLVPFASHYHSGGALRVTLTRLGGRWIDPTANLGTSLKKVEDILANVLLADDSNRNGLWNCSCFQEGGPVGVRVEVERFT